MILTNGLANSFLLVSIGEHSYSTTHARINNMEIPPDVPIQSNIEGCQI